MKRAYPYIGIILLLAGCKQPYHYYAQQSGGSLTSLEPEHQMDPSAENSTYALRIKDMNVEQLRDARMVYERSEEPLLLSKVLERLIKLSPDHQERASCTAQLATMQLGTGQFEKARTLYQQFLQEYPGSPLRKQVMFRLIMAYHWDRAEPDKDQELTLQTMQLCDRFISEYGTLSPTATPEEQASHQAIIQAINNVKRSCYYDLVLAELERLSFYATKYTITQERSAICAAHARLQYLLITWGSLLQSLQAPLDEAQELAQQHDYLKRQDGAPDDTVDDINTQYDDPLGTVSDLRQHLAQRLLQIASDMHQIVFNAREQDGNAIINQLW
jgi:hypothetical protein